MPTQLQLRRGTTTEHNNFVGALGEITVDTDKKTIVVHDGTSNGGYPLAKASDIANTISTAAADATAKAASAYSNAIAYANTLVANLANSAPATLDTLRELANALGNDANFSTTVLTGIGNAYTNAVAYAASNTYVNTTFAPKASPTFTGTVTIPTISANGSTGTAGQVLTSNGSAIHWSDVSGGTGGFTNGQSISVGNISIAGALTANNTSGTSGQILYTSGPGGIYWGDAPAGSGSVGTLDQVLAAGNTTTKAMTVGGASVVGSANVSGRMVVGNPAGYPYVVINGDTDSSNPVHGQVTAWYFKALQDIQTNRLKDRYNSYGTAGQVLTTDGTNIQWANVAANGSVGTLDQVLASGNTTTKQMTTGNIVPTSTYTYNLGSSSNRWGNFYTLNGDILYATLGQVTAGGSTGTAGQVLTSNGSAVYWSTPTTGGGSVDTAANYTWTGTHTFSNNVSIPTLGTNEISSNRIGSGQDLTLRPGGLASNGTVFLGLDPADGWRTVLTIQNSGQVLFTNTAILKAISANGTTGTAGQVLTSNGSATYWESPAVANGSVGTLDQVLAAGNTTTKALTVGNLTANGITTFANIVPSDLVSASLGGATTRWQVIWGSTLNANTVTILNTLWANNTTGTAGQVLTSAGTGNVYWSTPSTANSSVGTLDQVLQAGDTTTASMSIGGMHASGLITESLTDKTGSVVTYTPALEGPVLYMPSPTSNFTVNIQTIDFTRYGNNKIISLNILVAQGPTPYGMSSLSIDGTPVSIKWAKNTAPVYTPNNIDSISLTLIYRSGIVGNVLASIGTFGVV